MAQQGRREQKRGRTGRMSNNDNSQSLYLKNDLTGNCMLLLSTTLGMVSRLKYIVSIRARPPSTAGLGYGKSEYILLSIISFGD